MIYLNLIRTDYRGLIQVESDVFVVNFELTVAVEKGTIIFEFVIFITF